MLLLFDVFNFSCTLSSHLMDTQPVSYYYHYLLFSIMTYVSTSSTTLHACTIFSVIEAISSLGTYAYATGFMETVPNCTLEVTRLSILKISIHYNQPRTVSTRMKVTQKVDHFTVFNSFPSTSGCSQKFPPNNL